MAYLGFFLRNKLISLWNFFAKKEPVFCSFSLFNLKQYWVLCMKFLPHLVQQYLVCCLCSKLDLYLEFAVFFIFTILIFYFLLMGGSFCSIASKEAINFCLDSKVGMYPFRSNFVCQVPGMDHSRTSTMSLSENLSFSIAPGKKIKSLLSHVTVFAKCQNFHSLGFLRIFCIYNFWISNT